MSTATAMIASALRLIGQLRSAGQSPSTEELAEGLVAANALLDSWNNERLNIPVIGTAAYTLVTTTASYSIGPSGATFTAARPMWIEGAAIIITVGTVAQRYPLNLISAEEYNAIQEKAATSDMPADLYYDHANPKGNLYLWPTPVFTGTQSLELNTWSALAQFPDLVTDNAFQPGYDRAIRYNLAIELHSLYPGLPPIPANVAEIAASSLAAIRALNNTLPNGKPMTAPDVNALPKAQ